MDREQVKQIVREAFWELVDSELLPLLQDFVGTRLAVSGSPKESQGKPQKESSAAVPEFTFTVLKYEDQKGEKLGEFQVAYRGKNDGKTWDICFNLLKDQRATIKEAFHPQGYLNKYWLYLEPGYDKRIFRKHLEANK